MVGMICQSCLDPNGNIMAYTPGNVPPWKCIAGSVRTTFRPVHQRQELYPAGIKELVNVFNGVFTIKLCPLQR